MPHRALMPKQKPCPVCGAVVLHPKKHRKWHKKNKPIPGPPGPVGPMGASGRDG